MDKNDVINWTAASLVGLAVTLLVKRLFGPRVAVVLGPAVAFAAHRTFDDRVAAQIRQRVS